MFGMSIDVWLNLQKEYSKKHPSLYRDKSDVNKAIGRVADDMVRYFFSAVDVLIQPYWSATQSGVTQIAYNFSLPMIVTNVGGLAEIVPDDVVGYVTDTNVESLAEAYVKFYSEGTAERMRSNMTEERKRFSWEAMADCLTEVYKMTK